MSNKTLRDQITTYLSTVEDATAAQITKHTTEKDYPSRVLRELNDMRTDTLIECGKKGKGRDLSYWLTSAIAAPSAPAEIPTKTTEGAERRRQIIRNAIAGKTRANGPSVKDLAEACGVTGQAVEHLVAPMLSAGTVGKARNDGERFHRFFDTKAITPPQPEVGQNTGSDGSAVSVPDASTEAVAVQEPAPASCANTAPVAEDEHEGRGADIVQTIVDRVLDDPDGHDRAIVRAASHVDAQRKASAWHEVAGRYECDTPEALAKLLAGYQDAADGKLQAALANAQALTNKLQTLLDSKTHEAEALRAEVERLRESVMPTLESTEPEQAVDVLEAASAYLVRAPKRKPRILTKPESAREAALACARNGSGRGDVYALVYIGSARRGAEWKAA